MNHLLLTLFSLLTIAGCGGGDTQGTEISAPEVVDVAQVANDQVVAIEVKGIDERNRGDKQGPIHLHGNVHVSMKGSKMYLYESEGKTTSKIDSLKVVDATYDFGFAPDVVKDQFESRIRYQLNGAWTDWEDAEAIPGLNWNTRVQNMSQKYLQVLGGDLRKNLTFTDRQPTYDLILTYRPYNQWLYYSVKRLEYVLGAQPESVQIELSVLPTNGWDGDSLPNRSFVFPVFNVLENRHVE